MANKLKIKGLPNAPKRKKKQQKVATNRANAQVMVSAPKARNQPMARGLDSFGAAYARLLADPCKANLVPPAMTGANGGMITRFDYVVTIGNAVTDSAQTVIWQPNAQPNNGIFVQTAANDSTPASFGNIGVSPGGLFLFNNAQSYRCISACVQVMFPGTELNRSGFVATDIIPDVVLGSLPTTSKPSDWYQIAANTSRVPASMVEQRWYPSGQDATGTIPVLTSSLQDIGSNSLLVSAAGYPTGTGLRYRFVVVYEWWPKSAQGMVQNNQTVSQSGNTIDQVLRALGTAGRWAYQNADAIASTAVRLGLMAA